MTNIADAGVVCSPVYRPADLVTFWFELIPA